MTYSSSASLSEHGKNEKWVGLKTKFCGFSNLKASTSCIQAKAYGTPISTKIIVESALKRVREVTPARLANPIPTLLPQIKSPQAD